jgi:hypothetical protein
MNLHKEIKFEDEVYEHLAAHGWLYAERDAADSARSIEVLSSRFLRVARTQYENSSTNSWRFRGLVHWKLQRFQAR